MSTKNFIIGTAGHIDHGKTKLIQAISGTDTDRLSEEKKRGISIDLGFTNFQLSDDYTLGIIDVPGHEKFIKNMLAGAGGVDIALLVISADEGVMPQTREHLDILSLLNVKKSIIVVTKIDLVKEEWLDLMITDIKEKLSDTFLKDVPLVPVSAQENIGLDKLKDMLINIIDQMEGKELTGNVYYPIDRVFSVKGHGTIVTGTLVSGKIEVDDNLMFYPSHKKARVRSLEVHNIKALAALPGQRVGINISGVDKNEIKRGCVLATPDSLMNTQFLDCRLKILENAPSILENGDRIRFYINANEVIGRVHLLDKNELLPGESGLVQYRLDKKVVARFKESYVIRRFSPMNTLGGGNVLDIHPHLRKRFDTDVIDELQKKESFNDKDRLEYILKINNHRTIDYNFLIKKSSLKKEKIKNIFNKLIKEEKVVLFEKGSQDTWIHDDNYNDLKEEVVDILNKFHEMNKLKIGLFKEELRTKLSIKFNNMEFNQLLGDLKKKRKIKVKGSYVKRFDYKVQLSKKENEIKEKIINEFKERKFMPPNSEAIIKIGSKREEVFNYLVDIGKLIHIKEDLFFISSAVDEAENILIKYLKENKSITLAQFRDLLASSRRYTLALLEYFDQKNITIRKGEKRFLKD